MDPGLRDAYNNAVSWLLTQTPDWLDPYVAWIAAAILAVAVFAFVLGPVLGVLHRMAGWWQGRERHRIWKWYVDRLNSGEMTQAEVREHWAREVAKKPDEHRLNIYCDLWSSWEAAPNTSAALQLPPSPGKDEEASGARQAFMEAARSADRKEQEALSAIIQGRLDVAARLLKESAQSAPGEGARRFRRFGTLLQKGHPELALQMFEEAARRDPGHAGSRIALGEAYRISSKGSSNRVDLLRKAATEFKAAAELAHDTNRALEAEALTACGRCLRLIGDDDAALQCLRDGLQLKETLNKGARPSINHHEIGLILARRGDLQTALHHQRVAAGLDRKLGRGAELLQSRSAMGVLYRRLGDLAAAKQVHQEVVSLYPSSDIRRVGELNNLGIVYRLEGRFADARKCHEEALQTPNLSQYPEQHEVVHNCLGDLALAEADPDTAEAIFTKTRAAVTKPAVARAIDDKLGVVARLRGQFDKAEAIHRNSLHANPQPSPAVLLNLAWALIGQDKLSAAGVVADARRLFEQTGQKLEIAECRVVQARTLILQKNYMEAARHLQSAAAAFREAGARKAAIEAYSLFESTSRRSVKSRSAKKATTTPKASRPASRSANPNRRVKSRAA